ncbi:MAG: hypothetical protein JRI43_07325, partial [Deltaproteobacteria bacterium]|nr:hypothetical protein [Deltaproteobacteria bacterium]
MSYRKTGFSLTAQLLALLLTVLFVTSSAWADDPPQSLEINVETSKERALSGLNVYAFTESGSYTGTYETTNASGITTFDLSAFEDGNYIFRVDYLGNQFWSDIAVLPEVSMIDVIVEEETAEATVTTGAGPAQGVRVYLFSRSSSYLSLYENTDANGKVSFELPAGREFKFRADIMSRQYWSDPTTILSGGTNSVAIEAGGGDLQVTVDNGAGVPMEGVNTYLFTASGSYLSQSQITDSAGMVTYSVAAGDYKVRADYLGVQFWSQDTTVSEDTNITLPIPHQNVVITVEGSFQDSPDPVEGITVYLFTASGSYMSQNQVTGVNGQVTFNLPEQPYKVRADYLGQQFWSDAFTWQDTSVEIPMADVEIRVTGTGLPLEDVTVYVFTAMGSYLSTNSLTDAAGEVTFRLPAGSYKFRADYQGSRYWSGEEVLIAGQVNSVAISTGGGVFTLTALEGAVEPLVGVNCYVFSETGSYLSMSDTTDGNGQVSFSLADGVYKFRIDYLGVQFWTEVYDVPTVLSDDF